MKSQPNRTLDTSTLSLSRLVKNWRQNSLMNPNFNHPTLQLLQQCKTLNSLKGIHAQMITTGLTLHTYPLSRLLLSSSTLATLSYTLKIFNHITNPTTFLFNTLISSVITHHHNNIDIALSLYKRILSHPTLTPNSYTYPSLFKACCSHPSWLQHGLALHTHVVKFLDFPYDRFVQASLLNFYSKIGELGVCRYLFDQISQPDLAIWNTVLSSYVRNRSVDCAYTTSSNESDSAHVSSEVLFLFTDMQRSLIRPNEVTLVALISACADLGALSEGNWAYSYVIKNNLKLNQFVGAAFIDMYVNCGCLKLAHQLFDQLPHKDTYCYNAMIRGFAIHGEGQKALDLFETMRVERLNVDDVTMVVIICACSHVGLVDEGCKYFDSMKEEYGVEPKLEHYGCLIDLLGRAGRFKEALKRIRMMAVKPNAVLWRSLLGAARVHGNLEIGEVALENLIELEPETSGNYVLLSNMYARMNKWDDVKRVRSLMKDQGVNKMPGSSTVATDGAMHEFLIGNELHPQ